MTRTLVFEAKDVRRLCELVCSRSEAGYPLQTTWDGKTRPPSLDLVKDSGVYLITNLGSHSDLIGPDGKRIDFVYASYRGIGQLDPGNPEYDWEDGQEIMGGDDCALPIPVKSLLGFMRPTDRKVKIKITHDGAEITSLHGFAS